MSPHEREKKLIELRINTAREPEKTRLQAQFGQRLAHLKDLINPAKVLSEDELLAATEAKPEPPKDPPKL